MMTSISAAITLTGAGALSHRHRPSSSLSTNPTTVVKTSDSTVTSAPTHTTGDRNVRNCDEDNNVTEEHMQQVLPPSRSTTSHRVIVDDPRMSSSSSSSSFSDPPTPIISNQSPMPTFLHERNGLSSLHQLEPLPPPPPPPPAAVVPARNVQLPRFSCPEEEPIIVDRSTIPRGSFSPFPKSPTMTTPSSDGSASSGDRPTLRSSSSSTSSITSIAQTITATILSSIRHGDYQFLVCFFWDLFRSVLPSSTRNLLPSSFIDKTVLLSYRGHSSNTNIAGTVSSSISSSSSSMHHGHNNRRRPSRRRRWHGDYSQPKIRILGLPNQGQTCFLNSVLQSLASLEPFLTYLKDITLYQEELRMTTKTTRVTTASYDGIDDDDEIETGCNMKNATSSVFKHENQDQQSFSRQLLMLLNSINSIPEDDTADDETVNHIDTINRKNNSFFRLRRQEGISQRRAEPKTLLKYISHSHAQFKSTSSYAEQQDAQELLQALLSVVIADAHLEHGGGPNRDAADDKNLNSFFGGIETVESGNDLLTSVIAAIEKPGVQDTHNGTKQKTSDADLLSDDEPNALSLSGFLSIVGEQLQNEAGDSNGNSLQSFSAINLKSTPTSLQEEKKQDHADNPDDHDQKKEKDDHMNACNQLNFGRSLGRHPFSKVLAQNLMNKVSSITPSPLSGWLGSTIRCCKCKHVRPIRNAPFLDVPLTPTSIPEYLGRVYGPGKPTSPNNPAVPPCSLEQCLANFTSVERVTDVECRNCTIRREIQIVQEERMMLKEAVETTEKRIMMQSVRDGNKGVGTTEHHCNLEGIQQTKHLRTELAKAEHRLQQLKYMDPDEDEVTSSDKNSSGFDRRNDSLLDIEVGSEIEIERSVAQKCLFFTRTPAVLCCHIQRRYFDPYSGRMEKCMQLVRFPEILDLSPYCAYSSRAKTSWAAGSTTHVTTDESNGCQSEPRKRIPSKETISYRLQSIIEHRGNAFGGHYVSYRKDSSGSWFQISDAAVTKVSWQQVQSCQAYMLFYEAMI